MSVPDESPHWRAIAITTFLPSFLFSTGKGAILPVLPIIAAGLGADLATAGLIVAMLVVGELLGDIPSGLVVARIGERAAMIGAAGIALLGTTIAWLAPNPLLLGAGIFIIGLGSAVFALARHAFLTTYVPIAYRARALSTLGGTHRLGIFVGPFLTAGILLVTETPTLSFGIFAASCLIVVLVLALLREPETIFGAASRVNGQTTGEILVQSEAHGLFRTIWARRGVLATVGIGSAIMSALRASRVAILPLWAVSIGLDGATAALVIGIAAGLDFALFYTGGWLLDRVGRMWVGVPCLAALSLVHLALGATHDLGDKLGWFVVIALLLAFANGLSAGILMTLGADFADPRNPAPFLGAWRFTNDTGSAAAPLAIAGVTAIASLPVAAVVIGSIGLVGAAVWAVTLPRYLPRRAR